MNATIEKQNGKTKINLCGENPLKILQLTDIHLGGGVLNFYKNLKNARSFKKTLGVLKKRKVFF